MEQTSKVAIEVPTGITFDIPGLLSFINTKGQWAYLNADWCTYVDVGDDNCAEKMDIIHPDDVKIYSQTLQQAIKERTPFSIDIRMRKRDGYYSMIRENGRPVKNLDGRLSGFSCIGIDIDDLKSPVDEYHKLNYIFQKVLDNTTDMIAVYDKDLRLISMNRNTESLTGIISADALGKTYLELFPGEENTKGYKDLLKVLSGEPIHNTRFDSEKTHRTYENFLFPLYDETGNVYGILAIAHDYTEQIKTTIELEKAYRILEEKNKELESSNKELGSFTYIASHDLQEPLRKIQAFGRRIVEKESEKLSDSGKDYLVRMVDAAKRMQNLIDSLLEFSRTSTAVRKFEESDLNILIEEVKKEMRFSIEEKHGVVEVSPLPVISVVPFQFKQLVANLFSNSLKYSKVAGVPKIKVTADIVSSKTINRTDILNGINYCRITFSDNGIGFDPSYSEQIFELFKRLHGRTDYSGSGIGLSICKKIAENHSGFIKAEGRPNEGASFYLYLPMKH